MRWKGILFTLPVVGGLGLAVGLHISAAPSSHDHMASQNFRKGTDIAVHQQAEVLQRMLDLLEEHPELIELRQMMMIDELPSVLEEHHELKISDLSDRLGLLLLVGDLPKEFQAIVDAIGNFHFELVRAVRTHSSGQLWGGYISSLHNDGYRTMTHQFVLDAGQTQTFSLDSGCFAHCAWGIASFHIENGFPGQGVMSPTDYSYIMFNDPDLGEFRTVGNDSTSVTYPTFHKVNHCQISHFFTCSTPQDITITNFGNVTARVHLVTTQISPNPWVWGATP